MKFYKPFGKVFEAQSEFILMLGGWLFSVKKVFEEDVGYLHGALVDRRAYTTLQDHLQNFRIRWHLIYGGIELGNLLLNVLDSNLDGR